MPTIHVAAVLRPHMQVGAYLFSLLLNPRKYRDVLDIGADSDPAIVAPTQGTPVSAEMRGLLQYTESWTHWPDSERVGGGNGLLELGAGY